VTVADCWVWRINFPMMDMPDRCKGHAPSLEQAQVEADMRLRRSGKASPNLNTTRRCGKDSKVRGLN
jgi:hypothetical protein